MQTLEQHDELRSVLIIEGFDSVNSDPCISKSTTKRSKLQVYLLMFTQNFLTLWRKVPKGDVPVPSHTL